MSNWVHTVTKDEWDEWLRFARKVAAKNERLPTTLGGEDYAQQAIEKLLLQSERPDNVKGWLTRVINNSYIDRFRKVQARGGRTLKALDDDEWEFLVLDKAIGSPSARLVYQKHISELLDLLTTKEKEMLILSTAGFTNHEIAEKLDFKDGKTVATRLKQISKKVQEKATQLVQKS